MQQNHTGPVELNVAIANGTFCLEKARVAVWTKVREPKEVGLIHFFAVADKKSTGL